MVGVIMTLAEIIKTKVDDLYKMYNNLNVEDNKKKIVGDGFLYNAVNNYLKGNILEQPDLVDKLIMFFGSYFDAPYEGDDINLFFGNTAS